MVVLRVMLLYQHDGKVSSDTPVPASFSCAPAEFMSAITYFPKRSRQDPCCGETGNDTDEQGVTFYISAQPDKGRDSGYRGDCGCPDFRTNPDPLAIGLLNKGLRGLEAEADKGQLGSLGLLLSLEPGSGVRWQISDAHPIEQYKYPRCDTLVCPDAAPRTANGGNMGPGLSGPAEDAPYALLLHPATK